MSLSPATGRHAAIGGAIGFLVFAVDATATLIRLVLNSAVAERATAGSLSAMPLFLVAFVAAGVLAGCLWRIPHRLVRYVLIGTLAGALVWTYLAATWPLTAKMSAVVAPREPLLDSALLGAALGALAGGLLFVLGAARSFLDRRD